MAKAKTTKKTTQKATRTQTAKETAAKSTAKKAAKPAATKTTAKKATQPAATITKSAAAKSKPSKQTAAKKQNPAETAEKVTVDRRAEAGGRRKDTDRRKQGEPVAVERRSMERRAKVNRRRQIDPTTCERDYTDEELEFMSAMDDYKRSSGRMFPTCSEVLEVIRGLGYAKRREETIVAGEQNAEQTAEQPIGSAAESHSLWHTEQISGQPETLINAEKIAMGTVNRAADSLIDITDGEHLIDSMHVSLTLDLEESDYSERVAF